jgi:hypothetical protein
MTDESLPRGTSQTSETGRRVPDSAYDTWLTKAQAAAAIGRSEKAVQRLAADGLIQQASCQRDKRGPFRTVYHPDDVARIAAQRQPGLQAFVLPAGVDGHANGNGHETGISPITPLATADPAPLVSPEQIASVVCSFVAALQAVSKTSRTAVYVDKTEALAIAGVSYGALRAAVQAGEVKQRGRRYRRQDLEAL